MVILKSKETYIYINIIKTKIQNKGNDLINTLTSIIKEKEITKDYYDSLTEDDFREFLINYMNKRIECGENNI